MKIRSGFISNSSSSSFVAFIKASDYDDVFKDLSEIEKELLQEAFPCSVIKTQFILNEDVYSIAGSLSDESCWSIMNAPKEILNKFSKYDSEEPWYFADSFYSKINSILDCNPKVLYHRE